MRCDHTRVSSFVLRSILGVSLDRSRNLSAMIFIERFYLELSGTLLLKHSETRFSFMLRWILGVSLDRSRNLGARTLLERFYLEPSRTVLFGTFLDACSDGSQTRFSVCAEMDAGCFIGRFLDLLRRGNFDASQIR